MEALPGFPTGCPTASVDVIARAMTPLPSSSPDGRTGGAEAGAAAAHEPVNDIVAIRLSPSDDDSQPQGEVAGSLEHIFLGTLPLRCGVPAAYWPVDLLTACPSLIGRHTSVSVFSYPLGSFCRVLGGGQRHPQ